jgi:hypothetical protein
LGECPGFWEAAKNPLSLDRARLDGNEPKPAPRPHCAHASACRAVSEAVFYALAK